jgi:hypothetical protein
MGLPYRTRPIRTEFGQCPLEGSAIGRQVTAVAVEAGATCEGCAIDDAPRPSLCNADQLPKLSSVQRVGWPAHCSIISW